MLNGVGKTTLLCLLAGLDTPDQGDVLIDDCVISDLDEDGRAQLRADMVGFVFQNFQLLLGLTALENVMLPLELARSPHPRRTAQKMPGKTFSGKRRMPRRSEARSQALIAVLCEFVTPASRYSLLRISRQDSPGRRNALFP